MYKVLFVCTGNICRSPTADGIMRQMITDAGLNAEITCDSAGVAAYHVGERADDRSRQAAARRGYRFDDLRARQVSRQDFAEFDLILAMDKGHYRQLSGLCPKGEEHRLKMFLDFAENFNGDVPDPYYGGPQGFENVLDMVEEGCRGILKTYKNLEQP